MNAWRELKSSYKRYFLLDTEGSIIKVNLDLCQPNCHWRRSGIFIVDFVSRSGIFIVNFAGFLSGQSFVMPVSGSFQIHILEHRSVNDNGAQLSPKQISFNCIQSMMLELSWLFVCLGVLANFFIVWGAEKIDGPLFAREGVSSQATL